MKKILCVILCLLVIVSLPAVCFAEDYINPNLERVIDRAEKFTQDEIENFKIRAKELSEKYDTDILILTDTTNHGYDKEYGYIDDFWKNEGYGKGDGASGIALFICFQSSGGFWYTEASGDACKYVTYDVVNIVDDFMMDYMLNGNYALGVYRWLDEYEKVLEIGASAYAEKTYSPHAGDNPSYQPTPKTEEEIKLEKLKFSGIVALVIGIIAGTINLISGLKSMKSVSLARDARDYKDHGSFALQNYHNILLNVSVRREQINNNNSGGSHHSGGSSFSSHSSGGISHSGGGRHF